MQGIIIPIQPIQQCLALARLKPMHPIRGAVRGRVRRALWASRPAPIPLPDRERVHFNLGEQFPGGRLDEEMREVLYAPRSPLVVHPMNDGLELELAGGGGERDGVVLCEVALAVDEAGGVEDGRAWDVGDAGFIGVEVAGFRRVAFE